MRFPGVLLVSALMVGLTPCARAQGVVGEMYATDASVRGSVLFAGGGTKIESGSSVTAGDAAAALKLTRGGEVRICPRTTLSVTASSNGHNLMFGMNTGSVEAHYVLGGDADAVMTPDFRILLAGPGIFHFAISSDKQGNACVRALPQNTASLIVSELNGEGTYQVKPNVQVLFKNGKVADPSPFTPPDCGCPEPPPPVQLVSSQPKEIKVDPNVAIPGPPPSMPVPESTRTVPLPAVPHMEMEAPFVFQADNRQQEMEMVVARLRLTSGPAFADQTGLPPDPPKVSPSATLATVGNGAGKPQEKKGFMAKMRSFFAGIFK
jgi:hypothetical protein